VWQIQQNITESVAVCAIFVPGIIGTEYHTTYGIRDRLNGFLLSGELEICLELNADYPFMVPAVGVCSPDGAVYTYTNILSV
jgi:hypothetical protein